MEAPWFTTESPRQANQGHVVLEWEADAQEVVEYELQQAGDSGFSSPRGRYTGPDRGFFASGLEEGDHYFRVRISGPDAASPWSEALLVEVRYPRPGMVVALMVTGTVVFVLTVGAVLLGSRRKKGEAAP